MEKIQDLLRQNWVASLAILITGIGLLHLENKIYRAYRSSYTEKPGDFKTTVQVFFSVVRFFIVIATIFMILQVNGVDVSSLLAGLGIFSAFAGLALQDFLRDIIMGTRMLMDHFFEIGDVVRYEDFEGTVTGFDIRSTKLRSTKDNSTLTVCNRNISQIIRLPKTMTSVVSVTLPWETPEKAVEKAFTAAVAEAENMGGIENPSYAGLLSLQDGKASYGIVFSSAAANRLILQKQVLSILNNHLLKENLLQPWSPHI